jgi:hypothetical protein
VGVPGFAGEIGLEIEELIIVTVADLIGGGLFIEIGVDGVKPCGESTGLNGGEGG